MSGRNLRRCLPVHLWPEPDQVAWAAAIAPGNVLDDNMGRGALWRKPTQERVSGSYGRWLSYLIAAEKLTLEDPPTSRIDRNTVRGYVTMLSGQVQPWTVWSYTLSLYLAARAFGPDGDWEWLYKIVAKLHLRRRPSKDKLSRMRAPDEIAAWAYRQMGALDAAAFRDKGNALQYRNALFIAILANCPMRLRNLTMIRIGKHLQETGDRYRLDFMPHEVKTNRYLSLHLPTVLTSFMTSWIEGWRRLLEMDASSDALWLSIRGAPLRDRGVYNGVVETTGEALGSRINPHLFRDIAVTSIVDTEPGKIGITAPMLGHINPATTEEHYIHANQAVAGRRYRDSVMALRDRLAKEYGNPFKVRGAE
jgi:integrase